MFDGLAEVRRMRTEQHRGTVGGRFDHVLATPSGHQTSAHEGNIGQPPNRGQLADGINQKDRRWAAGGWQNCRNRPRAATKLAPPDYGLSILDQEPRDSLEPLGVARHYD